MGGINDVVYMGDVVNRAAKLAFAGQQEQQAAVQLVQGQLHVICRVGCALRESPAATNAPWTAAFGQAHDQHSLSPTSYHRRPLMPRWEGPPL